MGSIRPLITITILAGVGAYLYVKINEGPPPSHAAANVASQSPEGVPPISGVKGTSLASESAPAAWPQTTPSTPAASAAATAPALNTSASASAEGPRDKGDMPGVPAIPELPPLPSLNDAAPAAPSASPPGAPANKDLALTPPAAAPKDKPATSSAPLTTAPAEPAKPIAPAAAPQAALNAPLNTAPATSTAPAATDPAATLPLAPANAATGAAPPAQTSAQNSLRPGASPAPRAADPNDRYGAPAAPAASAALADSTTPIGGADTSSFTASWPAIQAALDRRDLKQAHQLLSKWHGDETLSPADTQKVETLLSQLAGTVIYSTEHQLEPARTVKQGETLDSIAKEYSVTPQLLAKINGIPATGQLRPGQELKVIRGPFSAVIDLSRNELMLSLADRYAGKFHVALPAGAALTDGQWLVDQKTTGTAAPATSAYAAAPTSAERSIVLRNATPAGAATTLVIAGGSPVGFAANPPAIRVSPQDAEEIADILSVGSRVTVRK